MQSLPQRKQHVSITKTKLINAVYGNIAVYSYKLIDAVYGSNRCLFL
jgi:hypothetical protein